MLTFYSPHQAAHSPLRELNNGEWTEYAESADRVQSILGKIGATGDVITPEDLGKEPILAVHDPAYVDFLENAHREWRAAGRSGDAIGYTFPVVRRRRLDLTRIDAKLGLFGFDAATPIAESTWQAAYWSAQSALNGLEALATGQATNAFALCRPPGHHAGHDYCGGYCYLNNAAIAAQAAHTTGLGPVAVLDVDYHHGNGTQDIFYSNNNVFFASIHADPKMDYPYFWGHADETGEAAGTGTTINLPLPRGTKMGGYARALDRALSAIADFGARTLIISFGADTFAGDPISHFALETPDMQAIGAQIGQLGLPMLTVMEGGYAIDALGDNVSAFLAGLEGSKSD
ncbi:MAG: histone deacetylase family protein [Erythrobacter sp.]